MSLGYLSSTENLCHFARTRILPPFHSPAIKKYFTRRHSSRYFQNSSQNSARLVLKTTKKFHLPSPSPKNSPPPLLLSRTRVGVRNSLSPTSLSSLSPALIIIHLSVAVSELPVHRRSDSPTTTMWGEREREEGEKAR